MKHDPRHIRYSLDNVLNECANAVRNSKPVSGSSHIFHGLLLGRLASPPHLTALSLNLVHARRSPENFHFNLVAYLVDFGVHCEDPGPEHAVPREPAPHLTALSLNL